MNSRGCYCELWKKDPEHFRSRGIPEGHCGICEVCKKPGHTRHFPGVVPYTGSWCDFHYRLLGLFHPLGFPGTLFYVLAFVLGIALWNFLR